MNIHVNPNFTVSKWGVTGSIIDGLVRMMPGKGGCVKMCFISAILYVKFASLVSLLSIQNNNIAS